MKTPKQLNLPKKFQDWRPGQGELVEQIAGSPEKVFLLDAPTGTGKSLIGIAAHQTRVLSKTAKEVLARLSGKSEGAYEHQCVYVTRTKQLQDQILQEFPRAKTIKGRANYPCLKHEKDFPNYTAEDCTHTEANSCNERHMHLDSVGVTIECPYFKAKRIALGAPLAVLNTSYFLTEVNGPGMFSGADLLIIDEIDALENGLMNYIQLKVTTKQLNRLGLELPKDPHSLQGWLVWADALNLWEKTSMMQEVLDKIPESDWTDIEIDIHRQNNRLRNFEMKIKAFVAEVNDSWIFFEEKNEQETTWIFKPVRVDAYAEHYLWRHAKKFLGMSGTILDPKVMAEDLGIENWDYAKSSCPFPLANRPIYYTPVANLTRKTMEQELPKLGFIVSKILERYPLEKVLVHTTSYAIRDYLMRYLEETIQGRGWARLMTHDNNDREVRLAEFKRTLEPDVMLSPSFDRGVDLPDDLCRCIIICKVPYVSLGDPQVKARMKMPGGEKWYLLKAAQTIMQMSGRGVRNEMDHCDCYILDKQFGFLLSRMRSFFPQWWLDAIRRGEL